MEAPVDIEGKELLEVQEDKLPQGHSQAEMVQALLWDP